jgi:tripartite-type tricarboxylate transporter receptor subunit TctC
LAALQIAARVLDLICGLARWPAGVKQNHRDILSGHFLGFLDLISVNYVPPNDPLLNDVFCEDGTGIDGVMIGGRMLLEDGDTNHALDDMVIASAQRCEAEGSGIIMRALRAIIEILCGLCIFAAYAPASAQTWPTAKPITIVVPVPPGPSIDMIARLVAPKLGEALGQTVVVDNRSGANGTIGSNVVARAAPDGYTLLAATPASHVTAVHLMKNLPFDPVKDFTPIMAAVEPVTALVVNAALPVNSVQELIAYAKANPGKLSYGSSGIGSVFHLTGELFNRTAGVSINHIPYRGVTQPMQDVAAGHIQMMHISLSSARGALASGEAKVLAILEPKRYAKLPNIPSMSEIIPAFRKPSTWFGFFGPAKLPPEIVARLNAEMRKAITAPEARAKLEASDLTIIAGSPEEFATLQKEGIEQFGEIIKAAGIKPQ